MSATRIVDEPLQSTSAVDDAALFANLTERCACAVLDLVLAVLAGSFLLRGVSAGGTWPMVIVLLLYFPLSWASPLHATPAQFLARLRVVDVSGEGLDPLRAILRGLLVIGLLYASIGLFDSPLKPYLRIVALIAIGCVLLAAVTPRRQALHDLFARSIVVRAKALRKPDSRIRLAELAADSSEGFSWLRGFALGRFIEGAIALGVPAMGMAFMADVSHVRSFYYRANYAISEAAGLQEPIASFYSEHSRFPHDAAELGVSPRIDYPDGGYFALEDGGRIRIRFSRIPELMQGSIVLSAAAEGGLIEWSCHADGGFAQRYLPPHCRDETD